MNSSGVASSCAPGGSYQSNAVAGPTGHRLAGSPAAAAGAQWVTLWNGNASGTYNTVKPKFTFVALSDQWRPNDRWLVNGQLRYENYLYDLVSNPGIATDFYAQIVQNDVCTNSSGVVLTRALKPGQPPPAPVIYTPTCAAGTPLPATDNYPAGIPVGICASGVLGHLATVVLDLRPLSAYLVDLHAISGYRVARIDRTLHPAAHLGVGTVPQRLGQFVEYVERYVATRLLLAVPPDPRDECYPSGSFV